MKYQLLVGNDWERLVPEGEWYNALEENHSLSFSQIKTALPEDTLIHNIEIISDGEFCESCLDYYLEYHRDKITDSIYCLDCKARMDEDES